MRTLLVGLVGLLLGGCGAGSKDADDVVADGSQVSLHLTMTVDGEVTQTTRDGDPFRYVQGAGQIFPGLEAELAGLRAGDRKSVVLPPSEAYGEDRPDAFLRLSREGFDPGDDLVIGQEIRGQLSDGPLRAWVTEIDDDSVTVDLDHPLAGRDVTIEVKIVEVRAAPLPQ